MSKGETFPNFHGQLDVIGLDFQPLDAPSSFSVQILYSPLMTLEVSSFLYLVFLI